MAMTHITSQDNRQRRVIFVLEPFESPSGGVAVIYRHVEILSNYNIKAYVALPNKPKRDFYGSTAPLIIHGNQFQFEVGDIWVIPEGFAQYLQALRPARIRQLMFCQNQYCLPYGNDPRAGFLEEFGVHGVIASSESIRSFFRDVYGMADVPIIPYAIDTEIYKPAPSKRRQVAFMPRKLPRDARLICKIFQRRHPRHADIPWVAIEGTTQREAARAMGESEIFLSLSHQESFGLPPLEAMACGCLVAGYHGDGGREYMNTANGWWAETGDWKTCVDGIAAAIDLLNTGGAALQARQEAMSETLARYNPSRMESILLEFWKTELAKPTP